MIFLQQETGMPDVSGAEVVTDLEARTGADALVSPLSFPIRTQGQLCEHLEEGAVLVQVKRGVDLPSSVGGRLMESLARMSQYRIGHWQKQLVYTGIFTEKEYRTLVNGRLVDEKILGSDWRKLEVALMTWVAGGGTLVNLPNDSRIPPYLQRLEKLLQKHTPPGQEAIIFPRVEPLPPLHEFDPERPLVQPVPAPVAMIFYASLPGVGAKRARAAYEMYGDDAGLALASLTHPDPKAHRPEGIGPGTVKSIRKLFILPPGVAMLPQMIDRAKYERGIEDDY